VSWIIKLSTPSGNYFRQTQGQLIPIWVEELWDIWDLLSQMHHMPTAAQISAARHTWDEEVHTYRTYTSVQQALKKQIITVFEPIYLDVLSDDMVGFANITYRVMLDHLFINYGNITAVYLENNFEHVRLAWDP
jgi:hypothetical protein